jgi:hypothetical protein
MLKIVLKRTIKDDLAEGAAFLSLAHSQAYERKRKLP